MRTRHSELKGIWRGKILELLEWAGCATGLCGAALNVAWIIFGLLSHAIGMVVMQIGFTATSLIGIWKWLVMARK